MAAIRKPFQGIWNIVRFNWHFYILALVALLLMLVLNHYTERVYELFFIITAIYIIGTTTISLAVSFYVYDISSLYNLAWLGTSNENICIVNINAGFDETNSIIKEKFSNATINVLDFYDATKHTEVSIERARKAYPSYPNTMQVNTSSLPFANNSIDKAICILAAHEIRQDSERIAFFKEINRCLKTDGQVFVTEHLRDAANFLAYNIGFLHFHSRKTWLHTFTSVGFKVQQQIKSTPFITTFILVKDGIAP